MLDTFVEQADTTPGENVANVVDHVRFAPKSLTDNDQKASVCGTIGGLWRRLGGRARPKNDPVLGAKLVRSRRYPVVLTGTKNSSRSIQ